MATNRLTDTCIYIAIEYLPTFPPSAMICSSSLFLLLLPVRLDTAATIAIHVHTHSRHCISTKTVSVYHISGLLKVLP